MGKLTTHVLDTAQGRPASGVPIQLYRLGNRRELVASAITNEDGRTEAPILDAEQFRPGRFELVFEVADYFAAMGMALSEPPFLSDVVIRFAMAADQHYHVPLLVSPWSYSTYRGS